jgi:hypothetical protein
MGQLEELINRIATGDTDMASAIPEFHRVLRSSDPTRPAGDLSFEQKEERAQAGPQDATDTFTEVTAAWIQGRLTDEQYWTLHSEAAGSTRSEHSEAATGSSSRRPWDDFSDIDDPDA